MATPNYGYEKRQKELAKKRKKEEKLKRKSEPRAEGDGEVDGEGGDSVVQNDAAPPASDTPGSAN